MCPPVNAQGNINLTVFLMEVPPVSFVLPAVSAVPGPAASARSASWGTQSGEGALCPGTDPERCLPPNQHRDSGWSWRREPGGGGHLPGVTSGPIALTSGLLPKPGTAAWRKLCGQERTTNTENCCVVYKLWQCLVFILRPSRSAVFPPGRN